jgi:cbb3-type cytochrome oxidase maturation protein
VEIIYVLIPLALVIVAVIIGAFLWSVRNGQFDDLEGPAWRILHDDDAVSPPEKKLSNSTRTKEKSRPD